MTQQQRFAIASGLSWPRLVAYRLAGHENFRIEAAPASRPWMDATDDAFARRCLPLLIANQHGWHLLNPHRVVARWHGGNGPSALEVTADGEPLMAHSHFGHGIITWTIPYLFRTPPGINLLVRGPANSPKDAVTALEGIVETDWCPATFTMNWKMTRPGMEVIFESGEPIAFFLPVRRGDLAAYDPVTLDLDDDADVAKGFRDWSISRHLFNAGLAHRGESGPGWQRHYFQGTDVRGRRAPAHETRLRLSNFKPQPAHQKE